MQKQRRINFFIYIFTTFILILSFLAITNIFISSKNKIREQMLKNSINHMGILSCRIKSAIHHEMEDFIYTLETVSKLAKLDFNSLEKTGEFLREVEEKGTFTALGVINANGEGINTDGRKIKIDIKRIMENASKTKDSQKDYFASNVFSPKTRKDHKSIFIAIPIYKNNKFEGILFGYQPVEEIAKKVENYLGEGIYFQVIDAKGNFIDSAPEISLSSGDLPLEEELKKHKSRLDKKYPLQQIKDNIKNGKKGFFELNDNRGGRYVVYEPLDINNWCLISILNKEKVDLTSDEIQKISNETLNNITILIIFIVGIIIGISYYSYRMMKKQNDKNEIFKILANKTKDIFFEIHISEEIFILYNFSEDKKTVTFPLRKLAPKNMLFRNKIKEKDLEHYNRFYKAIFERKNIEKFTIELNIENIWRWYRINSMTFNKDNIIGILEDFTGEQIKELEIGRINEKSKYDFLTGLYNRETFEKEFENFVNKNINPDKKSFLIILDLDNFKKVNDSLGHIIGDRVLEEASNVLKSNLKSSDIIGRLGGDEFIILIKNLDSLEQIHKIANSLNRALIKNYKKNTNNITVSTSIGITEVNIESSFKETYEKADKALYKVKNSGRNSYFIEK